MSVLGNQSAGGAAAYVFDFNIEHDPMFGDDPHESLLELARRTPEIFYSNEHGGVWIARSYDAIHGIMQDPELFASGGRDSFMIPIDANPPEHALYRKPLLGAFSPKRINALMPLITGMAEELVEKVAPLGRCEFVTDVAEPMPVTVFLTMLGVPVELMRPLRILVLQALSTIDDKVKQENCQKQLETLDPIIRERMANPKDDIISLLVQADLGGRRATFEEIQSYLLLLINAGLDTVVNAMSFSARHLAMDKQLQRQLREHPEQIPQAVEEFLRRYTPSLVRRYLTRDAEYRSVKMKAGDSIILLLPAGNLDEHVFPNAGEFELGRDDPLITFGVGIHRCLGSHLARLEMRVVLEKWLARIPEFEIDPDQGSKARPGLVYSVDELHLRWTPAAAAA
jgi:cytochrome P450